MTFATSASIASLSPVERRAYAMQLVANYAQQSRTVNVFRNHFSSLKMISLERSLGIDFQKLIDYAMKSGEIRVTNGIVWTK